MEAGALARALHERWLSRAMVCEERYPTIPLRRVDQGGYSRLMEKRGGPELAAEWWRTAFDRIERVDETVWSDDE